MTTKRWGGRQAATARAQWAKRLPQPCCRCGRPVTPDAPWDVDHYPVPRELGGRDTWPAHAKCNRSSGGKRGAAITNARRQPVKTRRLEERPMPW